MSFDACLSNRSEAEAEGRRRNPLNWTYTNVPKNYLFSRGYTGHEHLDQFKLINMPSRSLRNRGGNGRMYDPLLARFLSPDKYVQGADFTQSYNRYSYVQNNPLSRVDPSGWKLVPYQPWAIINNCYINSADFGMHFRPFLYDVTIGPESGLTTYDGEDYGLGAPGSAGGGRDRGPNTTGIYTDFATYIKLELFYKSPDRRTYYFNNGAIVGTGWISQQEIDKVQTVKENFIFNFVISDILSKMKKERGHGLSYGNTASFKALQSIFNSAVRFQGAPTKESGGIIYGYNNFISFMIDKANNESVEVGAFLIYNPSTNISFYFIQPWLYNTAIGTQNSFRWLPVGYSRNNVEAQYHTHLKNSGRFSKEDAQYSASNHLLVHAVYPDGRILQLDYCSYSLVPIFPDEIDY